MTLQTELHTFPPRTLVEYHGGGYDGCITEENFAFIDAEGEFHDLYSSGCRGCPTLFKLRQAYADRPWDFDLYDLNKPEECLRAGRELPISCLLGVARLIREIDPFLTIEAACDGCVKLCDVCDMYGGNPHGIGGVRSEFLQILCPACTEAE